MKPLLGPNALQGLIQAALLAELWEPEKRRLLFFRMMDLRAKVSNMPAPDLQLRMDLQFLNTTVPRNGEPPLLIWLQNARPLVAGYPEQDYFENLLAELEGRPAQPAVPASVLQGIQNEAILFQDDMLPIGYLQAGIAAGRGVTRLLVPRYENGVSIQKKYWGTGWLITKSLLMTNHHVFNARDDHEPAAAASDFETQALQTQVQFDIDSNEAAGQAVTIKKVVYADANLDYAIVRIETENPRAPLIVNWFPFNVKQDEVLPINIIQHPGGQAKRIAIRNNLATTAPPQQIRYFTATLGGSSGAPVLNDRWEVVGIHRGAIGTKVLNFQGRSTAVINVGTQMAAIQSTFLPDLRAEILA